MSKRNFVIGAGISGLIFKYYNPNYTIISPEIGGQLTMNIKAPRVLHDTKENKKLLDDLNILYKKKTLKIKYFYNNKLQNTIDKKNIIRLINKKLSHSLFKLHNNVIRDFTLSVKNNKLKYLDCDMDVLIKKLKHNIDIVNKKVILISIKNKYITLSDYTKFYYDNLVSTIPAPDFAYLCFDYNFNNKFLYLPATIVKSKFIATKLNSKQWDWLYYIDDDEVYTRISKNGDGYIYEISGDLNREEIEKFLGCDVKDFAIQRVSTIFSEKVDGLKNVKFLGRLACWNHEYKIQDVIKNSMKNENEM